MIRRSSAKRLAPRLRGSKIVKNIAFPRWVFAVGMALLVIWMTVLVAGIFAIYIADEYVTPAVSEQSVPPPRLY
jgi:hypothetical protein